MKYLHKFFLLTLFSLIIFPAFLNLLALGNGGICYPIAIALVLLRQEAESIVLLHILFSITTNPITAYNG